MTTDLIKSYGNQSKQLILMESSMSDLYDKKHTNNKDRKNFQENRRQFQIRKPLPTTPLAENVFQQKDVKDVQICYADLRSEDDISESSKLPNEGNIDDSITPKESQITQESEKFRTKSEEIRAVSTISEMIANITSPSNNASDVEIVAKQEKNRKKKEKRMEAKARKAELMTSKKDATTISGEGSSKNLKAEASEMSPKIESPNKTNEIKNIEKKNQQTKEKMEKVLTRALLASKSDSPATSVQKSSSKQPTDESLNIGAKGIGKMFAKKREQE